MNFRDEKTASFGPNLDQKTGNFGKVLSFYATGPSGAIVTCDS